MDMKEILNTFTEGQDLACQQGFIGGVTFTLTHSLFTQYLTQLRFNTLEQLVDTPLQAILFKHQRMTSEDAGQARITLTKTEKQQQWN